MKKFLTFMMVGFFLALPVFAISATTAVAQTDDEVDWDEFWDDLEEASATDADEETAGVIAGMGIILFCCIFIGWFIFWGAICYFLVYKDAINNNVSSPGLWFVVSLFFGLLGLILYFLVGKKSGKAAAPAAE